MELPSGTPKEPEKHKKKNRSTSIKKTCQQKNERKQ
jgi:hypothetical protein